MLSEEKAALRPLPLYPFETAKCSSARVSAFATARFATNDYSVPCAYAGRQVGAKAYPETIEIFADGNQIAVHERCFGKHQTAYKLMPLLEQRGRAILNAAPVRQSVPEEVVEELRAAGSHEMRLNILRRCATAEAGIPEIHDEVVVQSVDLRLYDALSSGNAVSAVGR